MAKLADLSFKPPKILIYGPPGVGKTALMLTLGEGSLILDMDDNLEVGLGLNDNLREDRCAVDVEQFLNNDPKHPTAGDDCKKFIIRLTNQGNKGQLPYTAVGLDSITSLAAAWQDYVMWSSNKLGENPQIQHWGELLNQVERTVTYLRALPIPVIVLAHETTFTSDTINKVQIAIPGQKLPGRITRMFSEIWYVRNVPSGQGNHQICLQTVSTGDVECRSGRGLPTRFVVGTTKKDGTPGTSKSIWESLEATGWTPQHKEIPAASEPQPTT